MAWKIPYSVDGVSAFDLQDTVMTEILYGEGHNGTISRATSLGDIENATYTIKWVSILIVLLYLGQQ